ncbi:MAG: hypothetical protein DRN30_04215 [Thermoplasmata archaeon]|nr:MAG: hypothetical protein DRN30_04215 [Thermoplasmata archaeon]
MSFTRKHEKKITLSVLLLSIVLFSAVTTSHVILVKGSDDVYFSNEVIIPIPAVAQTKDRSFGVISYLSVKVVRGSGHVYIETWPLAEVDMQASARIAARIAFDIASKYKDLGSFYDWDYLYSIKSDSPIIGGPSAGAAMTIATVGALLGLKPKSGIVITGMINPDGTIGAVGGILEKIDAAASINATTFLVPYGQLYVNKTVMEKYTIGPFVYYRSKTVTVDVKRYAYEKYGIQVHEVLTIYDALHYFFENLSIEPTIDYLQLYKSSLDFYYVNTFLENASEMTLYYTKEYFNKTLSQMDSLSKTLYRDEINKIQRLIDSAEDLIGEHLYYSALSILFQANTTITCLYNVLNYRTEGDKYIEMLIKDLNNTLNVLKDILRKDNLTDGMIAAQIRVIDVMDSLERAGEYYKEGDTYNALEELSYAQERLKTVFLWMNFSSSIFSAKILKEAFDDEISFATLLYAYIYSMYGSNYASQVLKYIELSEKAYSIGFYGGAYLYALEARAHAESFLDLLGISHDDLLNKIAYVRFETMKNIEDSMNKSISPLLSLAYFEYSYFFEKKENDLGMSFIFAKLARSWVSTYLEFGKPFYGNLTLNYTLSVSSSPENKSKAHENESTSNTGDIYDIESRAVIVAVIMFALFIVTIYLMRRD